ncbi:putative transcription factor MYB-HB-like family [Medicago truncatula]|uniref:Putative transcription factor MYB-HB-like family n=1 Tax=Medicago truncatula TaxID=3880 RepID=A0A396HJV9_MEDTR|nr:cell division cycle 5-like protein [Medicago truncatula]RHN53609.1 putative transcription factor MYB-HB-like family [Medicago truncatula]
MSIMTKKGVWKNTEDEILKAAVMKYGKNQWARISSLLVCKSAKQCKARWYEWLDPSIKKTEWTREEDEKLLHLAKVMPTQRRTISVGRTPSQCLERYEKLLDAACVKDGNYEPGDDPRKLRPGGIDPNPESKPPRPDPVDMDEDEKEMLSEACARLANTKGKKAKRKAREKQLEEAGRLASLQKKRELKAAGIDIRQRRRKRRGIDYNAEIPFEKRPPPGYFDVADEDREVEQRFPTTIEELEGKRRIDVEAQLRKQDVARNKIAERQDAPAAILHARKLNDPETVRKRSKLMLPPPQISDQELDEIAKFGYASDLVGSDELTKGSSATRALLPNYPQTPNQAMTPLRTPQRTPAGKGDAIMMEAENLARLRESQTLLLGGENPELHPSDFSGVTPKKKEIHIPSPLLTPSATPGSAGLTPRSGMTPARDGFSFGMTPKGTPLRDELHINEDMEMRDSAKLELRRQADMKKSLRSGLSSLPQPKNEYQIVMQPIQEDAEEPEEKIEEDMSDRMAREKAEEEARQQALLRKRSKVLQRELPTPPPASLELIRNSLIRADGDKSSFVPPTPIEQADEMIRKELQALLEHDNAKYPLEEIANKEREKGSK